MPHLPDFQIETEFFFHPGRFGTILSQNAWLPVLRTLGAELWCEGRLTVSRAHTVFDDQGRLTDDKLGEQVRGFMDGFVTFVRRRASN